MSDGGNGTTDKTPPKRQGNHGEEDRPDEERGQICTVKCLDGVKYLVFLQHILPELLQRVPAIDHQDMHDVAPGYVSIAGATTFMMDIQGYGLGVMEMLLGLHAT
ncbi:hypothetical protein TNCV_2314611 [Trichonephila clavipes]|nr:hypothetical protein TNCV_2314611 [Trichonephila clavipes]